MSSALPADGRTTAAEWLQRGKTVEALGTPAALAEAVQAYDAALAVLRADPHPARDEVRYELTRTWMNRARARQKAGTQVGLAEAVQAYDAAIAAGRLLPLDTRLDYRNCLGAAWLNRGQVLLQLDDPASVPAAIQSQEEAVTLLRTLPLEQELDYRLNLAGAELNLANALLIAADPAALIRTRAAARDALAHAAAGEDGSAQLADLGLKARRALCETLGRMLALAAGEAAARELATEASDAADSGLALARHWEQRGVPHFRPLAERLYRFGARLYQLHQPHFLAEFLLENLDPASAPAAWTASPGFQEIARTAVRQARQELGRRPLLNLDPAATAALLATSRALAEAEQRIAALAAGFSSPAPGSAGAGVASRLP